MGFNYNPVFCKACLRIYDGKARCCADMDHIKPALVSTHIEEIRKLVKSNPEANFRMDEIARHCEEVKQDFAGCLLTLNRACDTITRLEGARSTPVRRHRH